MNKKLLKQIHLILLPLWQSYTVQDIWEDVKNWKIDDTGAIRRIKIIRDDFETEAEYKLFTDHKTSIEELSELQEECEGNDRNLEDEPLYKEIKKIIKKYSKAYLETVFDAQILEEREYMASECSEECPPCYIQDRLLEQKMEKAAKELGAKGGQRTKAKYGKEHYERISKLGKIAIRINKLKRAVV